jgi:hypothetical protein
VTARSARPTFKEKRVSINLEVIGRSSPWVERAWTSTEVMLYALGVGAGQDPCQELEFTTENSSGVALQVLPTFALILSGAPIDDLGDFDPAMRVHGEQRLELHRQIPVEGCARTRTVCSGIWDKGSGALFEFDSTLEDAATGELIATSRMGSFVRGEGGFGGPRGAPVAPPPPPQRPPDHRVTYDTRTEQALVYRLTGDRAPSHSDPTVARLRPPHPPRALHLRLRRKGVAAQRVRIAARSAQVDVRPVQGTRYPR